MPDSEPGQLRSKPSVCFVAPSAPMLRLLLGSGPAEAGGSQMQLALIGAELVERCWAVRFIVGDFGQDRRITTDTGIELISCYGETRLPKGLRFVLHRVPRLWGALRKAAADVYICQGIGWETGLVSAFCSSRGARCIIRMGSAADPLFDHDAVSLIPRKDRWLAAYGLRHARAVTAQTREQLDLLRARSGRNGVLLRNVWSAPDDVVPLNGARRVLWAGRIEGVKRPHMLLDVSERLQDIQFVMAGGRGTLHGDCFDAVQQRAHAIPNVAFRGFVPPPELDGEYAAASVLVCTSEIEGFPNTFLQAWGRGRPVVTTFDPDEVICRLRIGVHCRSVAELAEAVRMLCDNPREAEAMGTRGRAYVRMHHSPDVVIPKLEELLHDVVRSGRK